MRWERTCCVVWLMVGLLAQRCWGDDILRAPRPVPRMQVLPLPRHEASFTCEGRELTHYWFDPSAKRTFLYPLLGPAGRSLTRMGHPRDPHGHSHHNSVWIAHHNVAGSDFWSDAGKNRIVQTRLLRYEDSNDEALLQAELSWQVETGQTLVKEFRTLRVRPAENDQWWLLLDLEFHPPGKDAVTFGTTPFGFVGVRLAKTIGVHDGGGTIRNDSGERDEAGTFRRPARWVDYSGPITTDKVEGITLFDHPANPGHPVPFHVRDDGWMGPSPTLHAPLVVEPGKPLRLRYALFVHAGLPSREQLDQRFALFAATPAAEFPAKR